uniref:di-heme oxidoredictase family protein n=1 Tax=Trichocoleus desertorum TaxID=1481672 RepID=UPI0025B5C1C3|nr:di-heme oxidoredictase family protein [Trichocoleus desertorum]
MRLRTGIILIALISLVGFLGYSIELTLPTRPPNAEATLTPITQSAPSEVGSYDVLGKVISRTEAEILRQTEEGKVQLASEIGAVEVTDDLIQLGKDAFYRETFGNEYFFTDVVGAINGPINLISMSKAILALKGEPTTNLQIKLDQDVTVGGKDFPAGTILNTGLDVPKGSLLPLGMVTRKKGAKLRVGLTCAACHATVDKETGLILEGAPNVDVDTGLLQAFATNSAAMFRQTGINPKNFSPGDRTYINVAGQTATLPDAKALEDAVDAQLLAWSPGNFDSSPDNVNNPAQIPPSYTHETFPYGWSGFASVGWFHGLTTLNNNVHAVNSDPTSDSYSSKYLLGLDQETTLGVMLQKAADPRFRLPEGVKPTKFFEKGDPTPGEPGINEVIKMPGYPRGSVFILNGLMANSPGMPLGAQLNGMSVFQNTLAPPPYKLAAEQNILKRGAAIFDKANCAQCHSGRYFTNHDVIPVEEIKTQSSRASALAKIPQMQISPETYPPNISVPLPTDPAVLPVPTDMTPDRVKQLAYAINNNGGFKVQHLIGLYTSAPYLHDGGVAATAAALQQEKDGSYSVANPDQMGMAGTWMQNREPDPEASLRVLVDRQLRQVAVAENRDNLDLQATHVDGSGHEYWVDQQAGFSPVDQTALIEFLLAIDDDPEVLPASASAQLVSLN